MSTELVSVVIPYSPVHTPEKYLQRAIQSIESQTIQTEVLVVTDSDQRGPAWARNKGIQQVNSRFVAFCDADDYWKKKKIEKQIKEMEDTGSGLCLTQTEHQYSEEKNVEPFSSRDEFIETILFKESLSFMSSILIDRSKVDTYFDDNLKRREDHLFALQAAKKGVCFVSETQTIIHKHPNGLSSREMSRNEFLRSELRFTEELLAIYPYFESRVHQHLHKEYHRCGRNEYFDGRYKSSIDWLTESLRFRFHHRTFAALLLSYLHHLIPFPNRKNF